MAFPPNLPSIVHTVINTDALEQLALRTGISGIVIPNVLDYENPPITDKMRSARFRQAIGLIPKDRISADIDQQAVIIISQFCGFISIGDLVRQVIVIVVKID